MLTVIKFNLSFVHTLLYNKKILGLRIKNLIHI